MHTYITLHYITLHYITLHYTTLHYTTLHYITLHYITYTHIHTYLPTYIINARRVASTHITSFLSVQVHGESQALTCRPAGFTRRQRARPMVSSLGLALEPIGGSREIRINYTIAQIGVNRIQHHSSHVMRMIMHDT